MRRLLRRCAIACLLLGPLVILLLVIVSNFWQRRTLVELFNSRAGIEKFKETLGAPSCEFDGYATNECRAAWEVCGDSIRAGKSGRYYYWAIESLPYYNVVVGISPSDNYAGLLAIRINQKTTIFQNSSALLPNSP